MNGPDKFLVTKSSATHCRHWEDGPEHICAVARTHSDLVKFAPHDPAYGSVRQKILGISRRAVTARDRSQTTPKGHEIATPAKESLILVPYSKNPDFIGRFEILENIKQEFGLGLQQGPVQSRRRVSLYGLGGVG